MQSHPAFKTPITPDNAAVLLIDHQVGLFNFLTSIDPMILRNNILGFAKVAKAFNLPVIMGTSWPQGPNGPTMPELLDLFPDVKVIDRPFVNFWADPVSRAAVQATGRKKLLIAGLATEVCVALPACSAAAEGYEVYAVIDASADFNPLITEVTMSRLASAGVINTTWVAVLAELAHNTQVNGRHIGNLLREHMGQYYAAFNNFNGVARNAELVRGQLGIR